MAHRGMGRPDRLCSGHAEFVASATRRRPARAEPGRAPAPAFLTEDVVPTASALVQRLRTVGSDLPRSVAKQIVALGADATPLLLCLLEGRPLTGEDGESGAAETCADCGQQHDDLAWARYHAVDLLAELREPVAIDAMLAIIAGTSSDEPIHDKVVERLPSFGAAALEPILVALAGTAKESETAESLCCILAALDVRDERILRALLALLKIKPRAGAAYLADYGDPAACPLLLAVIAETRLPPIDDSEARLAFLDVLDVYAALGGELPPDAKARIDAWLGG
jgi:hypothetical protein